MASADDMLTADKLRNQQIAAIVQALLGVFPRTFGTFTLAAAATTTVAEPSVKSNSFIQLLPANAAAATLIGSAKSPYVSVRTSGSGFTVATASGAAAAGTEIFNYWLVTPV